MKKVKQSAYEILNLQSRATAKEIKSAYKKGIRQYNPEHYPEKFMEIRESYEYFTEKANPEKIRTYPVYKKPLQQLTSKKKALAVDVDLPIEILSTVFETPFDLEKELIEILKQSIMEQGFTTKEE